jgi:hypothetical protein
MAFLDRPSWYGKPVFTRSNLRRIGITVAIVLFISSSLSLLIVNWRPDPSMDPITQFIGLGAAVAAILFFLPGWFIAVFFWFRIFVNLIKLKRSLKPEARTWNLDRIFNPRHGWRDVDLTETGFVYRSLVFDGVIGFILVQVLIWTMVLIAKANGLDLTAT